MTSPSKFLSSLTALGMLMAAPACTGVDAPEGTEAQASVATVRQAATTLTVTVDDEAATTEGMTAYINGRAASLDEVARLVGDQTAPSKEVRAAVDGGKELVVEGATGTLTFQAVSLTGLKQIAETTYRSVGISAVFSVSGYAIELRFTKLPTQDARVNEALAQAQQMNDLIQDLAKRYPEGLEKQDPATFERKEAAQLEKIATLYCLASGQREGCAPNLDGGGEYKPKLGGNWWSWVTEFILDITRVGVIPATASCPSESPLVQIYHDDEDNRNANSRWGWLGGTVSNNNTLFRFCRVDGRKFYALPKQGAQYNYAVLKLGAICPGTSRLMQRYFDNEDHNNQNWSSGRALPNVNIFGRGWLMNFCVFTGGLPPTTTAFPTTGFSYGVFAPTNMPSPYSLQAGYLYKDDEDNFNLNFWVNGPDSMMGGTNNTWMGLARVK